jgi:hypothetical protein
MLSSKGRIMQERVDCVIRAKIVIDQLRFVHSRCCLNQPDGLIKGTNESVDESAA